MPEQVFDKDTRELIFANIGGGRNPKMTREYVRTLEEVARMADVYLTNSTPANAVLLGDALAKVDRMRG